MVNFEISWKTEEEDTTKAYACENTGQFTLFTPECNTVLEFARVTWQW